MEEGARAVQAGVCWGGRRVTGVPERTQQTKSSLRVSGEGGRVIAGGEG